MVIDHGIGGLAVDRALQNADSLLVEALLIARPAQRVLDVGIARVDLGRPGDQFGTLIDASTAIHPYIAQIVQDVGIIGPRLQGRPQLSLGLFQTAERVVQSRAKETDGEVLIRRVQQRPFGQHQGFPIALQIGQLNRQQVSDPLILRSGGEGPVQLGKGILGPALLLIAQRRLNPRLDVVATGIRTNPRKRVAGRHLKIGLGQADADVQQGLGIRHQGIGQPQIDGREFMSPLDAGLQGRIFQRQGRAFAEGQQGRRATPSRSARSCSLKRRILTHLGPGRVIKRHSIGPATASLQKLAVGQGEQLATAPAGDQSLILGLGLPMVAPDLEQMRPVRPVEQRVDVIGPSLHRGQRPLPVARRRRDEGGDIGARPRMRTPDRLGGNDPIGRRRVPAHQMLHRLHQSSGLGQNRRHRLALGRQPPGIGEVAADQGGGKGL